jgi:riboflavin kinase/FMN adenylyltransferase
VAGKPFESVTHLGPLPTFSDEVVRLETHLLDYQGDLYGKTVRVEFIDQIRGVQKFSSIQELRDQIQRDVTKARQILGTRP